ncbi:hypothetical protein ASE16_03605 [Leifsonia sp. Root227]|nr:hypothetical protein ASE16_03605 [Leifsonia sp. Root227]
MVTELTIKDETAISSLDPEVREPSTRRIDALMFETLQRTAIEVKVSVADARRESWAKVRPWALVTHRFVYAVPAGLLERPPVYGAGLWWIHENGTVEVRRKATINRYPEPLPQGVIQTLAYRASGRRNSYDAGVDDAAKP